MIWTWCWLVSKCVRQHEIYGPHCYRMGKKPKTFVLFAKTVRGLKILKRNDCMIFLCMSSSSGPEIKQKEFIQHLSIAALGEVLGYAWLCLACQGTVHSQQRFLKEHRPSCSARLALSSTNSPAAIWLSLNPLLWRKLPMTWHDLTWFD